MRITALVTVALVCFAAACDEPPYRPDPARDADPAPEPDPAPAPDPDPDPDPEPEPSRVFVDELARTGGSVTAAVVSGDRAVVAVGQSLVTLDISAPQFPVRLEMTRVGTEIENLVAVDARIYARLRDLSVLAFRLHEDGGRLVEVPSRIGAERVSWLEFVDDRAYLCAYEAGSYHPSLAIHLHSRGVLGRRIGALGQCPDAIVGTTLHFFDNTARPDGPASWSTVDVRDASDTEPANTVEFDARLHDVASLGDELVVATDSGVFIYDPAREVTVAAIEGAGAEVVVDAKRAFVRDRGKTRVFDVTLPTQPKELARFYGDRMSLGENALLTWSYSEGTLGVVARDTMRLESVELGVRAVERVALVGGTLVAGAFGTFYLYNPEFSTDAEPLVSVFGLGVSTRRFSTTAGLVVAARNRAERWPVSRGTPVAFDPARSMEELPVVADGAPALPIYALAAAPGSDILYAAHWGRDDAHELHRWRVTRAAGVEYLDEVKGLEDYPEAMATDGRFLFASYQRTRDGRRPRLDVYATDSGALQLQTRVEMEVHEVPSLMTVVGTLLRGDSAYSQWGPRVVFDIEDPPNAKRIPINRGFAALADGGLAAGCVDGVSGVALFTFESLQTVGLPPAPLAYTEGPCGRGVAVGDIVYTAAHDSGIARYRIRDER